MGEKSSQASSHWSLLATIDSMRDADCLVACIDEEGFGDGRDSRSRIDLLRSGGVGGERPADDSALSAKTGCSGCPPCAGRLIGRVLRDGDRGHVP